MAGIEDAFEKFVTRVSGRERSPAEQPLSKYKSYSEQELLENIEAKYPNQLQSFSQEDYQLNTMPMFEPKDVAPPKSYSPMPNIYYDTPRLSQVDLADGGVASMFRERPGYQVGGTIDPMLALQRSPIDQYGYSDPVISALTGNIFTSGQRFRDVFSPQAGLMMQQAQAAGYSEPEMEELRLQHDFFPSFQRSLNEAYFGPTFQADPQKSAIDLATSIYNQRFQTPPSVQQQRPQTQYQYSSRGTPILQFGYTGTPSVELQSQIDLQKRALDRLESIYNKPMANIGGDERVHAFGNTGGYKYNQNELLQNILKSEQDAAARVTPTKKADGGIASFDQGGQVKSYEEQTLNKKGYETTGMSKKEIFDLYDSVMGTFSKRFSDGGRVSMSDGGLTTTVPPAKGPDSQGVESLFRRRYS